MAQAGNIPQNDLLFGTIAVRNGIATEAQVEECVHLQKASRARGEDLTLGEVLVGKGYCSDSDVREVLTAQGYARVRMRDMFFGRLVIRNELADPEDVMHCLNVQRERQEEHGEIKKIGDIFQEEGVLSAQEVQAVLTIQERMRAKGLHQQTPAPDGLPVAHRLKEWTEEDEAQARARGLNVTVVPSERLPVVRRPSVGDGDDPELAPAPRAQSEARGSGDFAGGQGPDLSGELESGRAGSRGAGPPAAELEEASGLGRFLAVVLVLGLAAAATLLGLTEFHLRKGHRLMDEGRYAEAEQSYLAPRRYFMETAGAYLYAARAARAAGDRERAETWLEKAMERNPELVEAHVERAELLWELDHRAAAHAAVDAALELRPSDASANFHKGRFLLEEGDRDGARGFLQRARRNAPDPEFEDRIERLLAEIAGGR